MGASVGRGNFFPARYGRREGLPALGADVLIRTAVRKALARSMTSRTNVHGQNA
jgi:hypothetical protein